MEAGESEELALVREMAEELGIEVLEHDTVPTARLHVPPGTHGGALHLAVWRVWSWRGDANNCATDEHDALAWFGADELVGLALAHPVYLHVLGSLLRAGGH